MINFYKINAPKDIYLSKPIQNEELLLKADISNFDREGYELLPIEQEFYKENGLILTFKDVFAKESGNDNGWHSVIQQWAYQEREDDIFLLDHSFCVFRFGYSGEAHKQLEKMSRFNRQLLKILSTRPKYGIDFCLDALLLDSAVEVCHFEWDFIKFDEFSEILRYFEKILIRVDWHDILSTILDYSAKIKDFHADDEGNFKTKLIGILPAFNLLKSF